MTDAAPGRTSGQPTAAPGWYPDPDGAPGLVRWWDGGSWSDVTTPAGPGVPVGTPFEAPARPPARPEPWEAPAPPARSRRTAVLIGASGLALVVVVVLALVAVLGGAPDPDESGPVALPPTASGPAFPPGTVRIIDPAAGISYPFLGNGWYEFDLSPQYETASVAGQYFITQDDLPDSTGPFIAQCTSGPVVPGFGWTGPDSLEATTTTLADSVRSNYYPAPNERTVRRSEALTVDGAAAWVVEFDLTWDVPGYDASGERAALLLVDVGRPAPAMLYLSIPNTHAELYGVIDRVLADVEVL